MGKTTEVKARVTVEDGGTTVLDRIRRAFLGAADAADSADDNAESFAKQIAATALGTQLIPAVMQVEQLAIGFAHAGVQAQAADQAVAGLIASVQGVPWDASFHEAQGLGDEIDEIALQTHQIGSDVSGAFNSMVELAGATEDGLSRAAEQTAQISTVANVLGKSAEGLGREFGFMSEGALKTKGQLFQLLQPTGIFGHNTKKAAEYWSKMTEESRMQQLAYGLEKVSSRLAQSEPTIRDYLTTLDNLKTMTMEKFSEPLTRSLEPALKSTIGAIEHSLPAIEKLGESLAKDVGAWVEDAAKEIEEGFQYLVTHEQEIRDALRDGYQDAKAVVQFILDHKEEIAIAFGANAVAPYAKGAAGAAMGVAQGAAGAYKAVSGAVGIGRQALDAGIPMSSVLSTGISSLGATAIAAAPAIAGVTAAIAALEVASEATRALQGAHEIRKSERDALEELAKQGRAETIANLVGGMRDLDNETSALWSPIAKLNSLLGMSREGFDQYASALQADAELVAKETRNLNALADEGYVGGMFEDIVEAYNSASQVGNVAAKKYAAGLLLQSGFTASTLEQAGVELAGGLDAFKESFAGANDDMKDLLKKFLGKDGSATPPAPKVIFNGAQFKIEQNFRDQDPDRVAVVFERDVARMTERRISAGTSTPFGG